MRLAAAHLPVLCVLFALHGARATSENPPTRRSLYCDGQGTAERVGFDMACPAYAIPETLNNETNPATNCSSLFDAYPVAPEGPYWLRHPVTGAVERKWCLFGDGLGPRTDAGRTEITFITPKGYGAGLTPMSFGSVVDFWSSGRMLRYPDDVWRAWRDTGYVATDAIPLPSWSEGALGTLSVNVGMIEFTADAPVIVRMHNTVKIDVNWLGALDDLDLWRERFDLVWCNAWRCAPNNHENYLNTHWYRVYERYFPAGTHALDTDDAAYQFFTPAVGVSKESDQPAELESAVAAHPPPTTYDTPTVNVTAPGYGAGLTEFDFGSSVDFWATGRMLRYRDDGWRAWRDTGYVATDADPLPSWSENALGTLSVNVGMIEFTTDAPVIVRMYNTVMKDVNWLGALDDLDLWRERFDLVWCSAWLCAPNNHENILKSASRWYEVFERYFPAGTHALDTDDAAYQFFKPAAGTLPGTEQPAELESAAYTPKPNLNPHLSPYSCASDQGRVVFSLVDDNDVKDLPDTAAEIAAGFYNPNAYYIGNAELETIDIKSAKMCLERSKARGDSECITNCVDIVDSLFSCSPGSVSSSGTKNMIIALTGQLEPNTCSVFYDQGTGCDSSSGTYCWSCHRTVKIGQASSVNNNWHAHGYGMNLHRSGGSDELFHYPGEECSEVFENGETFWDSFYIVVQE